MPDRAHSGGSTHAAGADVIVIGAGLAGLTAAVHAVQAGAKVRLIAQGWGQPIVTPGWISVWDRADDDVIAAVRGYAEAHPDHPYALAGDDALVRGLEAWRAIADEIGLPYDMRHADGHNLRLMTALGAVQRPMLAPRAMANGDLTDAAGPVLIVGFNGWRDFHPEMAAGNLGAQGIEARALRVDLPDLSRTWDLWPGDLAQQFDHAPFRAAIARQVAPHLGGSEKVGLPAVLGLVNHAEALADLCDQLGRSVFEIPTLPPNAAGVRLSNALRRWLLRRGVRVQIGHPVVRGIVQNGRCTGVEVAALGHANPFYADRFILAAGGLYNGGILSDESGRLWEPIFDLPVQAPPSVGREGWFEDRLLTARGHLVHRLAGLRVDRQMRPLNADGAPVLDNVYAVGHMIAGFNPLTDGCAEGIALATACKAVRVALALDEKATGS